MHIAKLLIPLKIVAKKNRLIPIAVPLKKGKLGLWQYKGRQVRVAIIPDNVAQSFAREAKKLAKLQLPAGFQIIDYPVEVHEVFHYYKNEPDTSGCFESVADALEGVVWTNDKYLQRIFADKRKDNANPRIEILVKELF